MEYEFDIFLSYNSFDKLAVRKLAERLKHDSLRVWFDEWMIEPGDSIPQSIQRGFQNSWVIVLVLSCHSIGAEWPVMERGAAIFRDPTNKGRRLIPLRLDDSKIPDVLNQYKFVDYRQENETEYQQLLSVCSPSKVSAQSGDQGENPPRNGRSDDQDPLVQKGFDRFLKGGEIGGMQKTQERPRKGIDRDLNNDGHLHRKTYRLALYAFFVALTGVIATVYGVVTTPSHKEDPGSNPPDNGIRKTDTTTQGHAVSFYLITTKYIDDGGNKMIITITFAR